MKTERQEAGEALRESSASAIIPVEVRPVSPQDLDGVRDMLARLSAETVYMRFHLPQVPEWAPEFLVGARNRGGFSLVAVGGGRVIGHAMYGKPVDGEAEIAVVVEDEWQAEGVGKLLITRLMQQADRRGLKFFTCASLGENRRVVTLVNKMFVEAEYVVKNSMRLVRMPLRSIRPASGVRKGGVVDG